MPWDCKGCGATVADDDVAQCPSCEQQKTAWTIVHDLTRTLVVARKKFVLQRGDGTRSLPTSDPQNASVALSVAEQITVLTKTEVQDMAAGDLQPASSHVVFVSLYPQKSRDLGVTLEVLFAGQPSEELSFPKQAEGEVPDVDYVKFLFVYGPEQLEGVSFPDIHIVDLSEDGEEGYAPTVEFTALGKKAQELPVSAVKLRPFAFSV